MNIPININASVIIDATNQRGWHPTLEFMNKLLTIGKGRLHRGGAGKGWAGVLITSRAAFLLILLSLAMINAVRE